RRNECAARQGVEFAEDWPCRCDASSGKREGHCVSPLCRQLAGAGLGQDLADFLPLERGGILQQKFLVGLVLLLLEPVERAACPTGRKLLRVRFAISVEHLERDLVVLDAVL